MASPKPPRKVPPGIEARQRTRRNGERYWTYRVRWKDPVTGERLSEEDEDLDYIIEFKEDLRRARRRGTVEDLDRGRETLAEFAPRWLTEWAAHNLTKRTLDDYASKYNRHLLPRIGHLQLRRITPQVVDKLKADMVADGLGAPTVRKALSILQAMLREAVRWGELKANPVRDVKKPPAKRAKVIVPLNVAQVEALLHELAAIEDLEGRALVELLAYGAARPQDALAAPWAHVGRRRLTYAEKNVAGKILPGAKTGQDEARSVEMLSVLRADLLARRAALPPERSGPTALIVARADGSPWTQSDYRNWTSRSARGKRLADGRRSGQAGAFHRAAAAADLGHITPYYLRHTYASLRIAEQRLSLQEIADELGHSLEVLSSTYSHVIAEYRGEGPIDPDQLIREARAELRGEARRPQNAPRKETGA